MKAIYAKFYLKMKFHLMIVVLRDVTMLILMEDYYLSLVNNPIIVKSSDSNYDNSEIFNLDDNTIYRKNLNFKVLKN